MDALIKARKLYEQMDFSNFAVIEKPKCYSMGKGKMRMEVVFCNELIEVLHGICDPGCKVEPHIHQQSENILCYKGEAIVTVLGAKHHLTPGATVSVPANTIHYTNSDAGCKVIVSRHPPVEGIY